MSTLLLALVLAAGAADTQPPVIQHDPIGSAPRLTELVLAADMIDKSDIFGAVAYFRIAGETEFASTDFKKQSGERYEAAIAASKVTGDVEYYFEAYDGLGNGPALLGSRAAPFRITVEAAAPVAVAVAALEPTPASAPALENGGGLPLGPIVTTASGALLAGLGAVLWFGAGGTISEIDAKYAAGVGRVPADAEAIRAAQSSSQLGSILMVAGGVVAAGGVVWFFVPTSSGASAGVEGSF